MTISNSGAVAQDAILYRAGDCFLAGSDLGYGFLGPQPGAAGCSVNVNNRAPLDETFTLAAPFGQGVWPNTVPVAGDWDGDGTDGIGTYDYATGVWVLKNTAGPGGPDIGPFVFWPVRAATPSSATSEASAATRRATASHDRDGPHRNGHRRSDEGLQLRRRRLELADLVAAS